MQQEISKKLAHQECCILNPIQQILLQKGEYIVCTEI
jgi:hypothetical protein